MTTQCILGCPRGKRAKTVHRIPSPVKYPERYEAWMKVLSEVVSDIEKVDYHKHRVCGNHFQKEDKYLGRMIQKHALPVLCLPGKPGTHHNCNCDNLIGSETFLNTKKIGNTNEDEHKYSTAITENKKYTSLLEKEHDYYSKPQKKDRTIDYMEDTKKNSTCIELLDNNYNYEFGKIGINIEDVTTIIDNTIEETLKHVETKQTKRQNIIQYIRKTSQTIKTAENNESIPPEPVLSDANFLAITENGGPQNQPHQQCIYNDYTDQQTLSYNDVRETKNTSIAEINSEILLHSEESTKNAKLDLGKLDEYKVVGSTTIVTRMIVPKDQKQHLQDPLDVHISDIGINDSAYAYLEDNIDADDKSIGATEDSKSYFEDNMSMDGVSSHLEDNIKSYNKNSIALFEDYALKASLSNNKDRRVEIAYALKFLFKQGKTAKHAVKDIIDAYGPGKMSLEEAECWYKEFKLGNINILRIISSGGPVFK